MFFNVDANTPLLWDAYARYLNAELKYSSNREEYQDRIISIIRNLEKMLYTIDDKRKPNVYYFLGFFYYKITDYLTAVDNLKKYKETANDYLIEVDKLKKCRKKNAVNKLIENYPRIKRQINNFIENYPRIKRQMHIFSNLIRKNKIKNYDDDLANICKSANELLSNIWDYHANTNWWNWWCDSPINSKLRKFIFGILLILVTIPVVSILHKPLISSEVNNTVIILYELFLIFVLISPSVSKIKGNDVEIEMQTPISMPLSPGKFEKLLTGMLKK